MSEDQTRIFSVEIFARTGVIIVDNMEIAQLYFIEDIYSWCKCGKLTMYDNRGMWEFLPFVGDEIIRITYNTEVAPKEWEEKFYDFKIFKVKEVDNASSNTVGAVNRITRYAMEFFFVEEEHFRLHNPAFSKTYVDELYYDIIKDIYATHVRLEDFIIDEPAEERIEHFSMSQRTPAECIRWLGERIIGDYGKESGYLFYSNTQFTEESFNITTLEHLLKNAPLIEDPGDPAGTYNLGSASNPYYINNIINASVSPPDKSTINNLARHVYLGYDHLRKYQIKREYDYFKCVDHYTMLGNYTLFNGEELLSQMERGKETLTGESGDKHHLAECLMDNMYYGQWIKQYCLQQLVSVIVRGHVLRYAGGQIEINWLSYDEEEVYNRQMVGRYLVKSITHQFSAYSKPYYTQKMVLIKNGYWDCEAEVTEATKKNTQWTEFDKEDVNNIEPEAETTVKRNAKGEVIGL